MFLASMATISLDMVIVSFIQVFVASATIEYALRMGSQRKMVYVVTDRGEALCEAIIAEGYGGATVLKGKGAYSGGDREIILTVTNNIMLRRLENLVFAIDDKALFIVENTFYVSGPSLPRIWGGSTVTPLICTRCRRRSVRKRPLRWRAGRTPCCGRRKRPCGKGNASGVWSCAICC